MPELQQYNWAYQDLWPIKVDSRRKSRQSLLSARFHDDDDDDEDDDENDKGDEKQW